MLGLYETLTKAVFVYLCIYVFVYLCICMCVFAHQIIMDIIFEVLVP